MSERVIVIGAGMAGLWTALALASAGRELVLIERDAPPPSDDPDVVFAEWSRRGVGHLRHSHAFLARLRLLIRDRHPQLLAELLAAGARDLGFESSLTPIHKRRYRPKAIDGDLVVLTSRRTTLELVIRDYVRRLPGVQIRSGAFVRELIVGPGAPLHVTGVRLEDGEGLHDEAADLVVDAAGRLSGAVEQLTAAGADITEAAESAGVIYFTRHYRLRPGQTEPPRGGAGPTNGDLGYLKFGVFPGDNGWFSITLCVPEPEAELRKVIVDPQVFDAICRQLPGPAPWIAPERAEAMSRVFGMGQLESRWRDLAPHGRPAVLGYVAVGDSLVRTNPLYGRGCSFAAVAAYALRDALEASADPAQRLLAYRASVAAELRPFYDAMRDADRAAIKRAKQAINGHKRRPTLRSRMAKSFADDGVAIAVRCDPDLLREALRGFHMLEPPQDWLKRPRNLAKILGYWAKPRAAKRDAYPPSPGPRRDALFTAVGVSATADRQPAA